ncbi:biotin/lipoyl-containing protein [Deinococcus sp. KNUC1210]|uniref:biotin/lipoyl-containing protein n=1 Tax=Deinococcus sp. KNUC1210 TaxID=2917691 RepID=UPI00351D0ECE
MSRQIVLPELAESVVEGEILKWLVQEGETVALEQPICEVMTDKVTVELPSPYAGTLEKHLVAEGGVVAVHAPIALISDAVKGAANAPATGPVPSTQQGRGEATSAVATLPAPPVAVQDEQDTSLFKAFVSDEPVQVSGLRGRPRRAGHRRESREERRATAAHCGGCWQFRRRDNSHGNWASI